jgi:FKBP-type peptidyl-prolyl cis-trans isomerase
MALALIVAGAMATPTATAQTIGSTMTTPSGLKITDSKVGTGAAVKAGATVVVDYTGAVAATGTIFQSSLDTGQPATLSLNGVIEGWKLGIVGMKVGGVRRLLIPADEAYGANPPAGSGIPANAPLVFDITLHSIQ